MIMSTTKNLGKPGLSKNTYNKMNVLNHSNFKAIKI